MAMGHMYWDNSGLNILDGKHVRIVDDLAYVTSTGVSDSLSVYDISDPTNKRLVDYLKTGGAELNGADGLEIVGDYAYISCWTSGNFTVVSLKGSNSYRSRYGGGSHRPRYEF